MGVKFDEQVQEFLQKVDEQIKEDREENNRVIENCLEKLNYSKKGFSKEEARKKLRHTLTCLSLAYVLCDVVNTFLVDAEGTLKDLGGTLNKEDKHCFNQFLKAFNSLKQWASMCSKFIYVREDSKNSIQDSDWWYNIIRLIEDRLSDNPLKTHQLIEYLLNMRSEMGIFDVEYDDFKREL